MAAQMTRAQLLRGIFKPLANIGGDDPQEEDYLSMLPPEFRGEMLRAEVSRLGGDPDKLTENQMAGLVLKAMSAQASESQAEPCQHQRDKSC